MKTILLLLTSLISTSLFAAEVAMNETDQIASMLQQGSLFWTLASFFGFGLLLSLTPCVFPMIPILSGIIVGHKGEITTKKALIMSIVFVLAMSVTYSMAGVLAGYFGENLQVLFQTTWILVVFSLVFVALAFSMFGYYEIQLPASVQSRISSMSNTQEGGNLFGVAIMGFLSALIVGPCVAPPLAGALIYIGQTGDAVLGGLSLFVMSLGMGAPLIFIGLGVSKLPKAGAWMDKVKYFFGILMLGVAIWLLDRVIPNVVSLILWGLLFTISPIKMGVFKSFKSDYSILIGIEKLIGFMMIIYGVLILSLAIRGGGDMLSPLSGWNTTDQLQEAPHLHFKKVKTLTEINKLTKENKMVMIDFYADWCISCKEIEKFVFSNKDVIDQMAGVLAIQIDVTKNDNEDKTIMKKFGIIGPPAILFFNNGVEMRVNRIIGEMSPEHFIDNLNKSKETLK